ncbi:hypothetical protein R1sor_004346 [Riccia sorocarpa]|uniref:Methyltransferase domain-containing protein n=1 Tax=Riccia sorocarpa TaxID=122646 RepID=A0ABD3HKR9_9MARC
MDVIKVEELANLSDSYYKSAFATFKNSLKNDNKVETVSTLRSKLVPLLPPPSEPLRILSVGAGTGDFDYLLLQEIFLPHTKLIQYDALEPSAELHAMFEKRLAEFPVQGVRLFKTTYGDFASSGDRSSYDVILFIHSMYYLPVDTIPSAMESLLPSSGGTVVVMLDSASGHIPLHKALGMEEGPHTRCLNHVLEPIKEAGNSKLDSNLKYFEVFHMPQWLDVEECFTDGSQVGLDLLSFAVNRDLRVASRAVLEEIRSQAKLHLGLEEIGGRRHWWTPEGLALISNSSAAATTHVDRSAFPNSFSNITELGTSDRKRTSVTTCSRSMYEVMDVVITKDDGC